MSRVQKAIQFGIALDKQELKIIRGKETLSDYGRVSYTSGQVWDRTGNDQGATHNETPFLLAEADSQFQEGDIIIGRKAYQVGQVSKPTLLGKDLLLQAPLVEVEYELEEDEEEEEDEQGQ